MVKVPNAIERLCASIGCHIFNLSNLTNKRFYSGGDLDNFRLSVVFMAPSGYSKSKHFNFFLHPQTGILSRIGFSTAVKGTFSTESWLGTITKDGEPTEGVLSQYKNGIIGADEFMRLGNLMQNVGVNNDEVYLMKALDTDIVDKTLCNGVLEVKDIGITLWGGLRPCMLGLKSGLARRFSFQIFLPTIRDSSEFRAAIRSSKMQTMISNGAKEDVKLAAEQAIKDAIAMDSIDYSRLYSWLDSQVYLPHFEESLFKRLALGWAVANGTLPEILVDDKLISLMEDEIKARDIIRFNPEYEAVTRTIKDVGRIHKHTLAGFMEKHYQLTKTQVGGILRYMLQKEYIALSSEDYFVVHNDPLERKETNEGDPFGEQSVPL